MGLKVGVECAASSRSMRKVAEVALLLQDDAARAGEGGTVDMA